MNKIILVGRLTRDPELRSTSMGISTANFTVAVNRNFKNKDGQYDADFISCVAFRNTADFVSKYFKKGNLISLDGRIQTRNYDAQDGTKRYVTEVVVENVEFVGGKSENSTSQPNNYVDSPSQDIVDSMPEYDIPKSDPYENYDKEDIIVTDDMVICLETKKVYDDNKSASVDTGANASSIKRNCNGSAKSAGGFTWKYYKDYLKEKE